MSYDSFVINVKKLLNITGWMHNRTVKIVTGPKYNPETSKNDNFDDATIFECQHFDRNTI